LLDTIGNVVCYGRLNWERESGTFEEKIEEVNFGMFVKISIQLGLYRAL
jgi:hypothetical protein